MTRWLDYAYAISGTSVDREYPVALYQALRALAPWLEDEALAGVHPLRGLTPAAGSLLVGGRTRLVLRVPQARSEDCARLQGQALDLPEPLHLGRASSRELLAHPVLHAKMVVTGAEDEGDFVADASRVIAELDLDCELIVGRRGQLPLGNQHVTGYSLMLHGLSAAESLTAQTHGVGLHRKLGCGLFVPHKSVAAVGL